MSKLKPLVSPDIKTHFKNFDRLPAHLKAKLEKALADVVADIEETDYGWRAVVGGFEVAHKAEEVLHYRLRRLIEKDWWDVYFRSTLAETLIDLSTCEQLPNQTRRYLSGYPFLEFIGVLSEVQASTAVLSMELIACGYLSVETRLYFVNRSNEQEEPISLTVSFEHNRLSYSVHDHLHEDTPVESVSCKDPVEFFKYLSKMFDRNPGKWQLITKEESIEEHYRLAKERLQQSL